MVGTLILGQLLTDSKALFYLEDKFSEIADA